MTKARPFKLPLSRWTSISQSGLKSPAAASAAMAETSRPSRCNAASGTS